MLHPAFVDGTTQAYAGEDPKVAAEIMALARAQWSAEAAGKGAAEQMATTAEDCTEFNADYPARIDGKALNTKMWDAFMSDGRWMLVHANFAPAASKY